MTKSQKFALTKNNGADLGFAIHCLIASAITLDEFKQWIYHVIEFSDVEDIPSYMFDLLEVQRKTDIYKTLNFVPSDGLTRKSESSAIDAIAFKRGHRSDKNGLYDETITKNGALKGLRNNPHILDRFKIQFPFIEDQYL